MSEGLEGIRPDQIRGDLYDLVQIGGNTVNKWQAIDEWLRRSPTGKFLLAAQRGERSEPIKDFGSNEIPGYW